MLLTCRSLQACHPERSEGSSAWVLRMATAEDPSLRSGWQVLRQWRAKAQLQKIDNPVFVVSNSNAIVAATELPRSDSPGDQAATANRPGNTATTPPLTPLLAGRP